MRTQQLYNFISGSYLLSTTSVYLFRHYYFSLECLKRFELLLSVWKTDMLTIHITGTYVRILYSPPAKTLHGFFFTPLVLCFHAKYFSLVSYNGIPLLLPLVRVDRFELPSYSFGDCCFTN